MSKIKLYGSNAHCQASIALEGSKSLSNRVLFIRALCKKSFTISNLSISDDTRILSKLLENEFEVYDAHHAGTTFRFMTAYLALKQGTQVLTGSERMKQRPIEKLVKALNEIGTNIEYMDHEGYPPLKIHAPNAILKDAVSIAGNVSSQYISTLLMIAPTLPNGLRLTIEGEIVSKPYIDMTLHLMAQFGVKHHFENQTIIIKPQPYIPNDFFIEADWSAASYYYSIAAIHDRAKIRLEGLHSHSLQGDSNIAKIAEEFGIHTHFIEKQNAIEISRTNPIRPSFFEYNFINQPDLSQTVFVMCAATGCHGLFKGLQTLKIKETDRIKASAAELSKVNVFLSEVPKRFAKNETDTLYMLEGSADMSTIPSFDTYNDHRMAMAFAPLALKGEIEIKDHHVVSKSYPGFWKDIQKLGFDIEES
jgi:3-phosphoshikimate 1-carboxyvinyltransferase